MNGHSIRIAARLSDADEVAEAVLSLPPIRTYVDSTEVYSYCPFCGGDLTSGNGYHDDNCPTYAAKRILRVGD